MAETDIYEPLYDTPTPFSFTTGFKELTCVIPPMSRPSVVRVQRGVSGFRVGRRTLRNGDVAGCKTGRERMGEFGIPSPPNPMRRSVLSTTTQRSVVVSTPWLRGGPPTPNRHRGITSTGGFLYHGVQSMLFVFRTENGTSKISPCLCVHSLGSLSCLLGSGSNTRSSPRRTKPRSPIPSFQSVTSSVVLLVTSWVLPVREKCEISLFVNRRFLGPGPKTSDGLKFMSRR